MNEPERFEIVLAPLYVSLGDLSWEVVGTAQGSDRTTGDVYRLLFYQEKGMPIVLHGSALLLVVLRGE